MATSTVQQINRQAPFMEDYIRKLLESTYQQTQNPVDLPLQKVADLDPNQIRAGELINQGIGQYQPLINQATQLISDPNAYQQFMSPYTSDVIDQVGKDINRQTAIQQNQLSAGAQGAGAFGGSRMGVAQGEIGRAGLDQFADTSARLREAGFTTAQNLAGQRAGQLGQMAATGQQLGQQDISNLLGIGSLYQGQAQAIADAQEPMLCNQYMNLTSVLVSLVIYFVVFLHLAQHYNLTQHQIKAHLVKYLVQLLQD